MADIVALRHKSRTGVVSPSDHNSEIALLNRRQRWMQYSIAVAQTKASSQLKVGVVLVSKSNELICSIGGDGRIPWVGEMMGKLNKLNVFKAQSLYLTINTYSSSRFFDLGILLQTIHIPEIYVGLPDPALTGYLHEDPIITCDHVIRYPDNLQREILLQNRQSFSLSSQSIHHSPYYSDHRISELLMNNLKVQGFDIRKQDLDANKSEIALASWLNQEYSIGYQNALKVVRSALSEAFNIKYGTYDNRNDARSLALDWKDTFMSLYQALVVRPLSEINVVNIGVANGTEAVSLFNNCKRLVCIDIAKDGLKKIQKHIPAAKCIVSDAANLCAVSDNSCDLYVSLRTYNSSFFNITGAIAEAHRVLKPGGIIIVSVANGFLYVQNRQIIPGLLLPGTQFVDLYRGMDMVYQIRAEFISAGFQNLQVVPTPTEIYIAAVNT